jgi:aprataxin
MAEKPENALIQEEIQSVSSRDESGQPPRKKSKNACMYHSELHRMEVSHLTVSELMSKKPASSKPASSTSNLKSNLRTMGTVLAARDGLLAYIKDPETFAASSVIMYDDDWVLIHDLYPKSSVHLLLLPRDPKFYNAHPYEACKDPAFLAAAKIEVEKARKIVASELRRLYGQVSVSEQVRIQAMESEDPPAILPEGRDWSKEVMSGIHANPSMNHLHIHVLSTDRHSSSLKHRKHYNSFNTRFFVPLEDLPLNADDERNHAGKLLFDDMTCWRCRKNFGNQFAKLKVHLEEEFQTWKKE